MSEKINRALRFYYSKSDQIYTSDYIRDYQLDSKIKPIHNPIKPAVNTLCSLTLQETIKPSLDNESIKKLWEKSKIQSIKYQNLIDIILCKYGVWFSNLVEGEYIIQRVDPQSVKYVKEAGELIQVEITGMKKEFIGGVLKDKEIKRTYYREGVNCFMVENDSSPIPLIDGIMPFAIIDTTYDIDHLIDIADDINEKKAWLRNIFMMHGNAILNLQQGGIIQKQTAVGEESQEVIANDGYNIFQSEGVLKYVEMQGNIATLMRDDVNNLIQDQSVEYPEAALSRTLAGGNISENTSLIRFADLEAKIYRLRSEFGNGLTEITYKALLMSGAGSFPELRITFEDIFPQKNNYDNEIKTAELLTKYKDLASMQLVNEYRVRVGLPVFDENTFQAFINGV